MLTFQQLQPILTDLDIPSESYLKSLKLPISDLNHVQIENFISKHERYTLCFDETPSRYSKAAVGLYSPDGDFCCIGIEQCTGKSGEDLLRDVKSILKRFDYKQLLSKVDSILTGRPPVLSIVSCLLWLGNFQLLLLKL